MPYHNNTMYYVCSAIQNFVLFGFFGMFFGQVGLSFYISIISLLVLTRPKPSLPIVYWYGVLAAISCISMISSLINVSTFLPL